MQGAEMGIRDIQDMDVVANGSAVGRGVIVAEDGDVRSAALDGLQDQGNEMGFVAAGFSAMGRGAGYVEIAEGDEVESGIFAIVGEDIFKGELGFAVRIDGGLGMVLGDGDGVGLAVNGAGGGEDEVADAVAKHGVEQENAAGYVGDVEGAGSFHGLLDEGFASEVHNGVDGMAAEDFVEGGGVAEIGLVKGNLRGDSGAMAFAEVVDGDDRNAGGKQEFGTDAADVAGGAGDENVQGLASLRANVNELLVSKLNTRVVEGAFSLCRGGLHHRASQAI